MPFVVEKRGDQWCVYTADASGEATGDAHGCHPTYEQARQQQKALYVHVPEARKAEKPTGSQGEGERYADPGYQDDRQPRYPVTKNGKLNADRVRAAWSYIHQPDNRRLYSSSELDHIEGVIKRAAREVGVEISEDGGKSMPEYLITVGPAVKAMGGGKVGGYLVQWGDEASADADGEFFTPDTDFDTEFPAKASIYYHHGLDATIGRRRLGRGEMNRDASGIWMEGQLDLQDAYLARIYAMAEAGKLGWSSGAVAHLTEPPRESPGGPIRAWALKEASLTPIPSDRRNMVFAFKACQWPAFEELTGGSVAEVHGAHGAHAAHGVHGQSLAENTDRWMDDGMSVLSGYQGVAAKAGRKLSTARRTRLMEMRQMIDDLLNETAPRDAEPEPESAPPPGMGEGEPPARLSQALPLPDPDGVYQLLRSAADQQAPWVPV